jgi:hypothetical protein
VKRMSQEISELFVSKSNSYRAEVLSSRLLPKHREQGRLSLQMKNGSCICSTDFDLTSDVVVPT